MFDETSFLANQELQNQFLKKGYVKITLLSKEEAASLKDKYLQDKINHIGMESVHSTADTFNNSLIKKTDELIKSTLLPPLENYLKDFKTILGIFLIKNPGSYSFKDWHQDWTMLDEKRYASASVWCALQDVDEYNGALRLVDGSHLYTHNFRCTPNHKDIWAFQNVTSELDRIGITIPLKAGEAIIYNHALIHASHPNKSDMQRVIAVLGIYDKGVQLQHYYRINEDNVLVYAIDETFFSKIKKQDKPEGFPIIQQKKISHKVISSTQFKWIFFRNYIRNYLT